MQRFLRCDFRQRPRARQSIVPTHRLIKCLGAMVAGVVMLVAGTSGAEACGRDTNFVDMDRTRLFLDGTARVTSSDGKHYNSIENGDFTATFQVKLCYPGALDGVIVHLGECTGHYSGCDDNPVMYNNTPIGREFFDTVKFWYAIPTDSDAGKSILQTCNARAEQQRGASGDLEIYPGIFAVTLGVDTRRDSGGFINPGSFLYPNNTLHEYSKTKPSTLNLRILCAPLPTPKITGAQLGVAAYGDSCPRPAGATVMINAEYPRPVSYKIERGNGATTTADWIKGKIELGKAPDGSQRPFLAAQHKLPALKAGTRKFRLWISDWGKTPWRTVNVDCAPFEVTRAELHFKPGNEATCPRQVLTQTIFATTRPGTVEYRRERKGGEPSAWQKVETSIIAGQHIAAISDVQKVGEIDQVRRVVARRWRKKKGRIKSEWVRFRVDCLEAVSGKVTLKSLGATSCEGEALVAIHTDGAGKLPYELECGPGRSWQRSVTVPDNKIGVDKVRFDVKNNERVTCTLRTRVGGKLKSLDGSSETFRCHRPSGASASTDLVPEVRPDPAGARPPRIVADPPRPSRDDRRPAKIADPPRVSCAGGNVRRGRCQCPRTHRAVRAGKNAWRCVRIVVADPPRKCPRGMVGRPPNCRPGACPKGQVRVRGRCIRPAG